MLTTSGGEELGDAEAKGVLHGCSDGMGLGASSCDVGEEEDDVRAGGDGVEEVAMGAGGVVARMNVEPLERRVVRWVEGYVVSGEVFCMDFGDCTLSCAAEAEILGEEFD